MTLLGAVLALLAATMFAVGSVAQHRAAATTASGAALNPGLLLRLVRRPLWLVATVADVTGMGLQVVALALAPLVLVQPLLVCGLLLAVPLAALVDHRRPTTRETVGMLLCSLGILVFVLVSHVRGGRDRISFPEALPLLLVCLLLVGVTAVGSARLAKGPARAVLLAAVCGIFYGVSSALVKLVVPGLSSPWSLLGDWAVYALLLIGGLGFLLNQSAFQAGGLAAPLATLSVLEPITGVVVGLTLLHEHVAQGPLALLAYALATAGVCCGVVLLAGRAPRVGTVPETPARAAA